MMPIPRFNTLLAYSLAALMGALGPLACANPMMDGNGGMGGGMGMSGSPGGGMMRGDRSDTQPEQQPDPNANQQAQINQIRQVVQKKNWALEQKMRDAQFQLHELTLAPKKDQAAIDRLYTRIGKLQHQMDQNAAEAQRQIAAILNRAQSNGSAPSSGQHMQHSGESAMARGARLDQAFCARCHAAPDPRQHTPAQWPRVVARMKHYMLLRQMPIPNAAQTHALLVYLGGYRQ